MMNILIDFDNILIDWRKNKMNILFIKFIYE